MKNILTSFTAIIISTQPLLADVVTTSKGLERIKTNLTVSTKNRDEYDKTLQVVGSNLQSIKKNKDISVQQKKAIATELSKNDDAVKKINSAGKRNCTTARR